MSGQMIESRLWKAAMLSRESTYFPRMVESAAHYLGVPWSDRLLRVVAANEPLVEALPVKVGETVDQVLERLATDSDTAPVVDSKIVQAVQQAAQSIVTENEPVEG